jgi:hypothetical protein
MDVFLPFADLNQKKAWVLDESHLLFGISNVLPVRVLDGRVQNILFKDHSGTWLNVAAEAAKELGIIGERGGTLR